MKKYLITGGAGFIGTNFIYYLIKKYDDIYIVNLDKLTYAGRRENLSMLENKGRYEFIHGDICDASLVNSLFEKFDFDVVVNFAAESHVDRSIGAPGVFANTNVLGTVSLLNAAKKSWYDEEKNEWKACRKFHQVSTDEVYGTLGKDGFFTEENIIAPRSPYSASKASADMFVRAFYETYGMPVNITRCSNNYGPYQHTEKMIPLMISNAIKHQKLPVYGDGLQIRDWLYVEDHCAAIDLVINKAKPGQIYNVGGHNEKENLETIKIILDTLSEKLHDPLINENLIEHVTDRKGHDVRYAIDPTKIKKDLGWDPKSKFEDGIVSTIEWYIARTC